MKEEYTFNLETPKKEKHTNDEEKENLNLTAISTNIRTVKTKELSLSKNINGIKNDEIITNTIKAYCRIKPINEGNKIFYKVGRDDEILSIKTENLSNRVNGKIKFVQNFQFSKVFEENSSQEEVFKYTCKSLIYDFIFNHKSGLMFTYGSENTGKTYTLFGSFEKPGIVPRALEMILKYSGTQKSQNYFNYFYCNLIEIYNEEIFDLFSDDSNGNKKKLNLLENSNNYVLKNVTNIKLTSLEHINKIIRKGIEKKANLYSYSYSHIIFKIILLNKDISKVDILTEQLTSLSFADLGGSQKQNIFIPKKLNLSLLTLEKCLKLLKHNTVGKMNNFLPFKESELTKILSEYFYKKNNIKMINNINPGKESFNETIRILSYSCYPNSIKPNKSQINKVNNKLKSKAKKEEEKIQQSAIKSNAFNFIYKNNKDMIDNKIIEEIDEFITKNLNKKVNKRLTQNRSKTTSTNELNALNGKNLQMKSQMCLPVDDTHLLMKNEITRLTLENNRLKEELNQLKNNINKNSNNVNKNNYNFRISN